ncbi:hypothetical protein AC249_AIPGENE23105 [Exaiptasia diaphana]|nr:hypothetical protein AC249_AIPGENE23105 [Exaiptasia diaphana]
MAETTLIGDASPVGLGAALVQKQGGVDRVVAYGHRSLSYVERRYSQTTRGALSLVWASDQHAPVIQKRVRGVDICPWLNKSIKVNMCQLDSLLSKSRKTNNSEDWTNYRCSRKRVSNSIKKAKAAYGLIKESGKDHKAFWKTMKKILPWNYGIPEDIVSAIRVLYDNSKCAVFVDGRLSDTFEVTTGVLQGDVLAPFLFVIIVDYVMSQSTRDSDSGLLTHPKRSRRYPAKYLNDLDFADDICLLESSTPRAQVQLDRTVDAAASD